MTTFIFWENIQAEGNNRILISIREIMRYLNVYMVFKFLYKGRIDLNLSLRERPFQKINKWAVRRVAKFFISMWILWHILFKLPICGHILVNCIFCVYEWYMELYCTSTLEWSCGKIVSEEDMLLTWGENTHSTCKPCGFAKSV